MLNKALLWMYNNQDKRDLRKEGRVIVMRILAGILGILFLSALPALAVNEIIYDFKDGTTQGWDIPDWSLELKDYVTKSVEVGSDEVTKGKNALKVTADFPGTVWRAACVEKAGDLNLTGYRSISADIYLPKEARTQLIQARIIITAGPWYFIEMRSAVRLERGKWTKVTAKLDVDEKNEASYWRCKENAVDGLLENISHVRKIAIRIEYNAATEKNTGAPYKGPVYISGIEIR